MGTRSRKRARGRTSAAAPAATATAARREPTPAALGWRALAILIIGIVTYAGGLSGPFIFDDRPSIVESEAVRAWPDPAGMIDAVPESPFASRPLVSITFAINYALHGLDVTGYHVVNIAVHLACALVLFGLVRRTLGRVGGDGLTNGTSLAFVSALIWTVHPLNSEVVNYVTQRTESMMALFYLLTFYAAVRALDSPRAGAWRTTAVVCCALGMACKETMVTAPVMLVIFDRVFVFGSFRDAMRERRGLYLALAGTWLVLAASMWSSPRTSSTGFANANTSVWVYLLNQTEMISRYLWLTVWPDALVLYYGWNLPTTLADVWPYAIVVVTLFVVSALLLARRPVLGFVGAWFFITLAPASSLVPIASEVGAERRMYLPVIPLIVAAVVAVDALFSRAREGRPAGRGPAWLRSAPIVLTLAVVTAMTLRTQARTREYQSSLTMAQTVLARWPTAISRQMVGVELVNAGRSEEALPHLRDAVATQPAAYLDYGTALFNVGRLEEAIEQLEIYLEVESHSPSVPRALRALARALGRLDRTEEAIPVLEQAIEAEPGNLETRGLLADAHFNLQQFEPAIRYYRDFLVIAPDHAGALANLAISLAATGQADEALDFFRRAVQADPDNVELRMNLALALIEQDEIDEAGEHAQRATELAPGNPVTHDLHGRILVEQGRIAAAVARFEQVVRLDPGNAEARDILRMLRGG